MKRALITTALGLCCHLAHATPLPSAEDFFRAADMRGAAISPQGHYVAMLLTVNDAGKQVLAVGDIADLAHARLVAVTSTETPIVGFRWINEKRLSYSVDDLRPMDRVSHDEFAVDRDGSNKRHYITGNLATREMERNTGVPPQLPQLPSDYHLLSVMHDGSDDVVVNKDIWGSYDPVADHSRPYRINTRTVHKTDLLPPGQPADSLQWVLDAAGSPRTVTTRSHDVCTSWYRQPGASKWTRIHTEARLKRQNFVPRFFDGSGTLYVSADYQGYSALFRFDANSMQLAPEPLLSTPGFDYTGYPVFDYPGQKLLGIRYESDAPDTLWFDPDMKALQREVDAALPQTSNAISCPDDCRKAPVVLVTAGSDRQPLQYYLYTRAPAGLLRLGEAHPAIHAEQMGWRDFRHYTARDGREIPVYVTLPPGKPKGPQPTVVLVHGGPFLRGVHWNWEASAQFLATRGYVVIEPEFRGSLGYGAEHHQAGLRQLGLSMEDDLADAAQWAEQQGWTDPHRIALVGGSYGGYATLTGLIRFPELFRTGVEWAGPSDLDLLYNTNLNSQWSQRSSELALFGDPDTDAAQFAATSPLRQAAQLTQPLLIAHGLQDPVVSSAHSYKMVSALRQTNHQVEWLPYPGEIHGWIYPADAVDFWQHVEAFLAKNL